MVADQKLIDFIIEVKRRGYNNSEVIPQLTERGWSIREINAALKSISTTKKEKVEIYLNENIIDIVKKRARKNLLSLPEQIEDIVRRSCVNTKINKSKANEKLDDLLVGIFSRRKSGKKSNKIFQ